MPNAAAIHWRMAHSALASVLHNRICMGKEYDLRARTMRFALDVRVLCRQFPDTQEGRHLRGQLFRAATGMAANYRAACRGRSTPEFIAKLGTAIEEGDEADFWMDYSIRAALLKRGSETALRAEANELLAILVQSRLTAQQNLKKETESGDDLRAGRAGLVLIGVLLHYTLIGIL